MEALKEAFITKAIKKHGEKYDYNNVEYINSKTKVSILCKKHNTFFKQTPNVHLLGSGCPKCGIEKTTKGESLESFITRANKVHNNKYDYSLSIKNKTEKIKIICKEHGIFEQRTNSHLQGRGCKKCAVEFVSNSAKLTIEEIIKRSKHIHGDLYDYSKVNYLRSSTKVEILCKKHGSFFQNIHHHFNGIGCPKCGVEKSSEANRGTLKGFIEKANEIHNNIYNYSKVKYKNNNTKVEIVCKQHGSFFQRPNNHIDSKSGCPICGSNNSGKSSRSNTEDFINKSIEIHGNLFDYSLVNYIDSHTKVDIICKKHGKFKQVPYGHLNGYGCSKCVSQISKKEVQINDFLSQYVETKQSNRKILEGKELDIYIPSKNLAIEFDGLYYHSDKFTNKDAHITKTKNCEIKGISLIHIFEDEWDNKQEIVKSKLLNLIGKTENKIFARKCKIKEISSKELKQFLEENHIQGNVNSKIKIGLFYEEELISVMSFGGLRKNLGQEAKEGYYELLRFCNKLNTTVIGGASKLLTYFEKTYNPKELISYADRRWSEGKLYKNLNFEFVHISTPNYFYFKSNIREPRFKYRKSELVKQGFDKEKTEKEIMQERGYYRIYDCGALKYTKIY